MVVLGAAETLRLVWSRRCSELKPIASPQAHTLPSRPGTETLAPGGGSAAGDEL